MPSNELPANAVRLHHVMLDGAVAVEALVVNGRSLLLIGKGRTRCAIALKAIPNMSTVTTRLFHVQATVSSVLQDIPFLLRQIHFNGFRH